MGVLSRKQKSESAVDPVAILRQLAKDRRAAWTLLRDQVLADRTRQRRENAKAARAGKFVVPPSLLWADLPENPPASFGVLDGDADDVELSHDRNGNPIHAGEDGRVMRTEAPQPALASHEEVYFAPNGEQRSLTAQDGRIGDEPGEQLLRIDQAAMYADLHNVSLEDARALLAEEAE